MLGNCEYCLCCRIVFEVVLASHLAKTYRTHSKLHPTFLLITFGYKYGEGLIIEYGELVLFIRPLSWIHAFAVSL